MTQHRDRASREPSKSAASRRDEPLTERSHPDTANIDRLDARGIVDVLHRLDREVLDAFDDAARDAIARTVDMVAAAFRRGGRLLYFGAGTSGRLGVLDASECPPTFGASSDQVVGVIAGGDRALRQAIEGAEDDPDSGARDVVAHDVGASDVVCGIATSGTTPYVLGALRESRSRGARSVLLCCNPLSADAPTRPCIDVVIELLVGPEAIAGSTRLKAGTATKLALNMISTGAMVRVGKVYGNLMVDVRVANDKLRRRAIRLVERLAGVDSATAESLLQRADWQVKTAVVVSRRRVSPSRARSLLQRHGGLLRSALDTPGGFS